MVSGSKSYSSAVQTPGRPGSSLWRTARREVRHLRQKECRLIHAWSRLEPGSSRIPGTAICAHASQDRPVTVDHPSRSRKPTASRAKAARIAVLGEAVGDGSGQARFAAEQICDLGQAAALRLAPLPQGGNERDRATDQDAAPMPDCLARRVGGGWSRASMVWMCAGPGPACRRHGRKSRKRFCGGLSDPETAAGPAQLLRLCVGHRSAGGAAGVRLRGLHPAASAARRDGNKGSLAARDLISRLGLCPLSVG